MMWACIGCFLGGLNIGAIITFTAMSLCLAIGEKGNEDKG